MFMYVQVLLLLGLNSRLNLALSYWSTPVTSAGILHSAKQTRLDPASMIVPLAQPPSSAERAPQNCAYTKPWAVSRSSGFWVKELLSALTKGSILPPAHVEVKRTLQVVPWFKAAAAQSLNPALTAASVQALSSHWAEPSSLPSLVSHCLLSATGPNPCSASSLGAHQDSSETWLLPDRSCSTATEGLRAAKERHLAWPGSFAVCLSSWQLNEMWGSAGN